MEITRAKFSKNSRISEIFGVAENLQFVRTLGNSKVVKIELTTCNIGMYVKLGYRTINFGLCFLEVFRRTRDFATPQDGYLVTQSKT